MNYNQSTLERLDDEDWDLARIIKIVMKPKG